MYATPSLPYDYSALEPWIDTETMHLHHDKHHQAYVDNLNKALEPHPDLLNSDVDLLTNLSLVPEDIRQKVRNNLGGHVNHTIFWTLLTPNPKGQAILPSDSLMEAISKEFGNFEQFKEKFLATALSRFGSGWAWLVADGTKLSILDTPNQDNPLIEKPDLRIILGLDVWEHAYYLKYQNRRADYVKAWWNVVNWPEANKRYSP